MICRTDIKDITDTTNTTTSHLENYCKKQSVGFIDNGNIKKSGLNSKGPHLHQKLEYFLSSITDLLDHYLETYEDFIVIGDFNESETSPALDSFLNEQKCKNIKNKTCFKSVKGSCIDLILTSKLRLHQFTNVFETGISDHHLLIYTMLKSTYTKMEPKFLSKRCFKNFSEQSFLQDLKQRLSNTGNFSDLNNNEFKNTLNDHAPIKTSKVCGNTKPHGNKILRKEKQKHLT